MKKVKRKKYYCIKTLCWNNDINNPIFIANNCYEKTKFYDNNDANTNLIAMLYNNNNCVFGFSIHLYPEYPNSTKFSDYFTTLKKLRKSKLKKISNER